ncbi:MAG: L-threonylcarbamoyladenylate synthase [Terriglobales bacterium]|jgi:L-threonylcarbamoyladenylate synthase
MPPTADPGEIDRAAQLIRAGRLVAFPTETVYGLGANALDAEAVARIYSVKRRPLTSPLIVHVSSTEMTKSLLADWPESAARLARAFWPGPLTLVLKKQPQIPDIVTAGLSTVAVRMPAHPIAQALIRAARVPLAAPSANRFTELSPTTADHVRESLGSEVDLILDGGPCQIGIESTVLSLAGAKPILFRPGGIPRTALEAIIGPVEIAHEPQAGAHPSPGLHPRHYRPRTTLYLSSNGKLPDQGQEQELQEKGLYLRHRHPPSRSTVTIHQMPESAADYAAVLYDVLHQADARNYNWIAVDLPPSTPEWEAIHDRLRRAGSNF